MTDEKVEQDSFHRLSFAPAHLALRRELIAQKTCHAGHRLRDLDLEGAIAELRGPCGHCSCRHCLRSERPLETATGCVPDKLIEGFLSRKLSNRPAKCSCRGYACSPAEEKTSTARELRPCLTTSTFCKKHALVDKCPWVPIQHFRNHLRMLRNSKTCYHKPTQA